MYQNASVLGANLDFFEEEILCLEKKKISHSVLSDFLQPHGLVAHQAPLSMEFFRQEYWSRLPFPSPGDILEPGMEPASLASPSLAGGFFTPSAT